MFRERGSRLGAGIRAGGGAYRQGSGRPGAPAPGRRSGRRGTWARSGTRYAAGAPSGSLGRLGGGLGSDPGAGAIPAWDDGSDASEAVGGLRRGAGPRERGVIPPRPIVPGERRYRDGDRVRHARWGDGIVITSKLTRDDEEVQVAFKDAQVGRKTMLASLANLELIG